MTAEQAIAAYEERFGGWPLFIMMSATDEYIIERVAEALRTGNEIEADPDNIY